MIKQVCQGGALRDVVRDQMISFSKVCLRRTIAIPIRCCPALLAVVTSSAIHMSLSSCCSGRDLLL